jgi:hypothetical protein
MLRLLVALLCLAWSSAYAAPVTFDTGHCGSSMTLSNGNLTATVGASTNGCRATALTTSGKVYYEFHITAAPNGNSGLGMGDASAPLNSVPSTAHMAVCFQSGAMEINSSNPGNCPTWANGSYVYVAVDYSAHRIWVANSAAASTWNAGGSANPATGVGGYDISGIDGSGGYGYYEGQSTNEVVVLNAGASGFNGTVPSGFSALQAPGGSGIILLLGCCS